MRNKVHPTSVASGYRVSMILNLSILALDPFYSFFIFSELKKILYVLWLWFLTFWHMLWQLAMREACKYIEEKLAVKVCLLVNIWFHMFFVSGMWMWVELYTCLGILSLSLDLHASTSTVSVPCVRIRVGYCYLSWCYPRLFKWKKIHVFGPNEVPVSCSIPMLEWSDTGTWDERN